MNNTEICNKAIQFFKAEDIEPNENGKYIFKSGATSINLPMYMADFAQQMIDEHEKALQSTHSKDIGELIQGLESAMFYVGMENEELASDLRDLIQKHSSNT